MISAPKVVMKKFSFPTENRQFRFEPKIPYDLVAERRGTRREDLTFPDWCAHEDSNLGPSP